MTIQKIAGLNPISVPSRIIRENPVIPQIPDQQNWRIPVLEKWLHQRRQFESELIDTKHITMLIDALCST